MKEIIFSHELGLGTDALKLFSKCFCFFFLHFFADPCWRTLHQFLGLLQAEAKKTTNFLDDLNLR